MMTHASQMLCLSIVSVKSRLESPQGISFTEFSYQLLQAYDFWYLYHEDGCRIQVWTSRQDIASTILSVYALVQSLTSSVLYL